MNVKQCDNDAKLRNKCYDARTDPRDEERGGINLYGFVNNDGVGSFDLFGLAIDFSDGMSFWESVEHFYAGGGTAVTIPFDAVDPGWEIPDVIKDAPCKKLAGLLSFPQFQSGGTYFDVYQQLNETRVTNLFQGTDIIWDSEGNSGPGQIDIDFDGAFSASKVGYDKKKCCDKYRVDITGVFSARSNLFDFDPGWEKGRSTLGENITIRVAQLQAKYGAGNDFWVHFSGGRAAIPIIENCCCKFNKSTKLYECD